MNFETRSSRVSFFGRFADDLTRLTLASPAFQVSSTGAAPRPPYHAQYKDDGYFVFADLAAPGVYDFQATSGQYQDKTFSGNLPANAAVELTFPGEDELFILITGIDVGAKRVNFAAIPFLRPIRKGAAVLGPGAFSAVLDADLDGENLDFAILDAVTGLNAGDPLRIIRSNRMILRPGPSYALPAGTTAFAATVVEATGGSQPIGGVEVRVTAVNGQAIATVLTGGLNLNIVNLPGPTQFMLGPPQALAARTTSRGTAIFYYPGSGPVTSLTTQFVKPGYVTTSVTTPLTAGKRTHTTVPLPRA